MSEKEQQERELINRFKNPSQKEKAFKEILGLYQRKVYWHVRRIVIDHDDADDVLQNTFIKVWEKLEDFRAESKLYTWIFRIATNEALMFLQRKKANLNVSMEELQVKLSESLTEGAYFNGNNTERWLQEAILILPEKQRLVFNMKYYEQMKYEEMEAVLGTSVGALKASYHHAVKKVEEFVKMKLNA